LVTTFRDSYFITWPKHVGNGVCEVVGGFKKSSNLSRNLLALWGRRLWRY
jgi:hypothetical protein